jgi:L-amino acid N-acyltransferase YncA
MSRGDIGVRAFDPDADTDALINFVTDEREGLNRGVLDVLSLARTLMDAVTTRTFVAVDGERVVGFVALHHNTSPTNLHVAQLRIHISGEHRGGGLGTRLMTRALAYSDTHYVDRIVATPYIPEPEDHGKIEFFRRFGFNVEGFGHKAARLLDGSFTDVALMARVI